MSEQALRDSIVSALRYGKLSQKDLQAQTGLSDDEFKKQIYYLKRIGYVRMLGEDDPIAYFAFRRYYLTEAGFKYLEGMDEPKKQAPSLVIHNARIDTLINANTVNQIDIENIFADTHTTIDSNPNLTPIQKQELKSKTDNLKKALVEMKNFGSPIASQLIADVIKKLLGVGM